MNAITIRTLQALKDKQQKFAMVTAYDATFAQLAADAGIETLLVGDSLGNVVQGQDSTVPVTLDEMVYHTRAVSRGNARSERGTPCWARLLTRGTSQSSPSTFTI